MGFLRRLFGSGGPASGRDRGAYVYLRCNGRPRQPCGEPIRVRINLAHDLEEEYESGDADRVVGYTLHKEVLGTRCQNLMQLTIHYDASRREVEREADGATLISAEEYERLRAEEVG